jgi:hypothetical protein
VQVFNLHTCHRGSPQVENLRPLRTCGHFQDAGAQVFRVGAGFQPAHVPPWFTAG